MKMQDCQKFRACNANLCPLDPELFKRTYLPGEPVCFYILESVKSGAESRFKQVPHGNYLLGVIRDTLPALLSRNVPLWKAVNRAKKTGARLGRKIGKEVRVAA